MTTVDGERIGRLMGTHGYVACTSLQGKRAMMRSLLITHRLYLPTRGVQSKESVQGICNDLKELQKRSREELKTVKDRIILRYRCYNFLTSGMVVNTVSPARALIP